MDRRQFLAACGCSSVAALAGCSATITPPTNAGPGSGDGVGGPTQNTLPDIDAPVSPFVEGNAAFGFALNERLAAGAPHSNRFISPYSIGVALAMTYAGAREETRDEMAEALQFTPEDESLHKSIAALRSDLPLATSASPTTTTTVDGESEKVPFTLTGANAVWVQTDFAIREAYRNLLEQYYAIDLGRVDFAAHHPRARRQINEWVADRTHQKIPELFPAGSFSRLTRLVLANAVYFEANWADAFDPDATEPGTFTTLDRRHQEVPLMHENIRAPYGTVDGHEIIQLPYAGAAVDMVVVLPAAGEFRDVERSLTPHRLQEWLGATEEREGDITLPRFEYRSSLSLPKYLQAMGMEQAFGARADFSGMTPDPENNLALGDVRHEATVTVDEQGTEAAAATGVEVVLVSAPANPFEMRVDRPFLFAIRHRPTGAILFFGRVVDAGAAQP